MSSVQLVGNICRFAPKCEIAILTEKTDFLNILFILLFSEQLSVLSISTLHLKDNLQIQMTKDTKHDYIDF